MAAKQPETAEASAGEVEFQNRIVGLEYVPAGELSVHPKNWRLHPEKQRSALTAALQTIGVADAVLAYRSERDGGSLTLIDGHLRRELLEQDVPVLVLDLSDAEADVLLASHDVITTMALRDEEALGELLRSLETEMPHDLMTAIDPDLLGEDVDPALTIGKEREEVQFPILPEYDEGYDSVIIFATKEADFAWLTKELDLPTVRDRKRIGMSHVLTADEFRERWLKHKKG